MGKGVKAKKASKNDKDRSPEQRNKRAAGDAGASGASGGGGSGGSNKKKQKASPSANKQDGALPPVMSTLGGTDGDQNSQHSTPEQSPKVEEIIATLGEVERQQQPPTMTMPVKIAGTEQGISQLIEFMWPAGADPQRQKSWATFMDTNVQIIDRMTSHQLASAASSAEIAATIPCAAGVPAAMLKIAGQRMMEELAAAKAAITKEEPKVATSTGDNAALLQNLQLLTDINPDETSYQELPQDFWKLQDEMDISLQDCDAEQRNARLLQAASKVLKGSAASVRAQYMQSAKDAQYEELKALIIAQYTPNDAARIQFGSLSNMDKTVSRFKNSQTLVAEYERLYTKLYPNGVNTGKAYEHKAAQFFLSILSCFPTLLKKQKGKEPKSYAELIKWFHLQFQGGVIPRGTAVIFAVHCATCSGYHPQGKCRLTQEDGAKADQTIDRQQHRRSQYRKPGGSFSKNQVVALDNRCSLGFDRQEEVEDFEHSIATLGDQFVRQNDQREAARGGGAYRGGRGASGRGRGGYRGREQWKSSYNRDRDHSRDGDRRDRYDNDVAREVRKQINALNVQPLNTGGNEE